MALPGLNLFGEDTPVSVESVFLRVFVEIKPRTEVPTIDVRFRRFANAGAKIALREGCLVVRISDMLERAPGEVLESLAHILLSKLYRRPVPRERAREYRAYLNRAEMRERIDATRRARGRKELAGPVGEVYDLRAIFERLNGEYFGGSIAVRALGWSVRRSRTTLGHWDASHEAIVISKLLDSAAVPEVVVEFVMYHEMLHVQFPAEHREGRRCVHTREFRRAEKLFRGFEKAKEAIRRLAS